MTPFLCKNINALIQNYITAVWLIWIIMIFSISATPASVRQWASMRSLFWRRSFKSDTTDKIIQKKITIFYNNLQVTCPQLFMPAGNDGDSVKVAKNHQNKVKLWKAHTALFRLVGWVKRSWGQSWRYVDKSLCFFLLVWNINRLTKLRRCASRVSFGWKKFGPN